MELADFHELVDVIAFEYQRGAMPTEACMEAILDALGENN